MPQTYDQKLAYNKERSASITARGRDIGGIPEVINPDRRESCRTSFKAFCDTYFAPIFCLPWSEDHLKAIATIEDAILRGGQMALAMPRGSGKTSLCEVAVIWAVVFGYRYFPIIVCASGPKAEQSLTNIKAAFESNDLLYEDFPEVCYPPRQVIGRSQAVNGQTCGGKPTRLSWKVGQIVLPDIEGSCAAGAVIRTTGIDAEFRGTAAIRPRDGAKIRPDLAIIDDPQTDETARSPGQVGKILKIINGTVMGLAGAGSKIAAFAPVTVIEREDVADQLLDRKRNPQWQGIRCKMLQSLPTDSKLWDEYAAIWSEGISEKNDIAEATKFYRTHQTAMDAGAKASWEARFNSDEASAIQHAMNLKLKSEGTFWAEYQNDPIGSEGDISAMRLEESDVYAKVIGPAFGRGIVPKDAIKLVAFVDVQKRFLPWMVVAFRADFSGHVVDYGAWPDQKKSYYRLRDATVTLASVLPHADFDGQITNGLKTLTTLLLEKDWTTEDKRTLKIDRVGIDSGWGESSDVVVKFVSESNRSAQLMATKGTGIGPSKAPMDSWKRDVGIHLGPHWRFNTKSRLITIDTYYWKSFVYSRFVAPIGSKGSLTIFNADTKKSKGKGSVVYHKMFAEQCTSETGKPKTENGRTVTEWTADDNIENHLFDCLVGCFVLASEQGVHTDGHKKATPKVKPKRNFTF